MALEHEVQTVESGTGDIPVIRMGLQIQTKGIRQNCFQSREEFITIYILMNRIQGTFLYIRMILIYNKKNSFVLTLQVYLHFRNLVVLQGFVIQLHGV